MGHRGRNIPHPSRKLTFFTFFVTFRTPVKIRSNAILLLSLALTMGACFYSNNGIYYVEPVPGDPAIDSITTSLDHMTDPTVTDSLDLEVEYRMQIWNGEPYYVDCWVDNYTVHSLGIYYHTDGIIIALSDTVIPVESDTTRLVIESDTLFSFLKGTLSGTYILEGLFLVPWNLPVLPGAYTLNMDFYFSANTNSLGDVIRAETDVTERDYEIIFGEGGEQ